MKLNHAEGQATCHAHIVAVRAKWRSRNRPDFPEKTGVEERLIHGLGVGKEETMKNGFHRILVGTDLSAASDPAVQEAIKLAKENGAELLFAHAYQPPSLFQMDGYLTGGIYQEWDNTLRVGVEAKLAPIVQSAKDAGIQAKALVLAGAPFDAITQAAQDTGADLVVLGTHGRTGVSRFFLGSVAARVISTAPCPVLTVRAA
jgi:nucleotide-binding universal stress UspA family protein